MTAAQGPTPQMIQHREAGKKGSKQMVSRDDLIKAIQQMQLPNHQPPQGPYNQQVYPPQGETQVWGSNG